MIILAYSCLGPNKMRTVLTFFFKKQVISPVKQLCNPNVNFLDKINENNNLFEQCSVNCRIWVEAESPHIFIQHQCDYKS